MPVSLIILVLILPSLFLCVGGWVAYQLLRQNGRILLRLEALEQQLKTQGGRSIEEPSRPAGLPLGSPAPEFELPDLAGTQHALSEWRGQRLLIVFFNPGCGYCTRMAADLAALPLDGAAGRPIPLVVTTGAGEANRRLVEEHGIRGPVLRQTAFEVAFLYKATGTPIGYLIDEQGQVASGMAVGAPALLALAAAPPSGAPGQSDDHAGGNGQKAHKGNRTLADSRINRSGLPAGTAAPDFRLPRLDGRELSLADSRGRRVLLVFSAPDCGPCNKLAPDLERFHHRSDVDVVMVSRGDPEANRQKVAEYGLTFPVVLQRQWEISRLYGIFATPVAYLIDDNGIILRDMAVGLEPIQSLLEVTDSGRVKNRTSKRAKEAKALTH